MFPFRSSRHRCLLALGSVLLVVGAWAGAAEGSSVGPSVEATVLLADGSPAVGATAELLPVEPRDRAGRRWLAGEEPLAAVDRDRVGTDGRLMLRAPHDGVWTVRVEAAGRLTAEILLPVVEDTVLPPLTLAPARAVEGRVVDAAGRPLAGARVGLRSASTELRAAGTAAWISAPAETSSGADGRFALMTGEDGPRTLAVRAPAGPIWLQRGFEGGDVRLAAAAERRLRVADAKQKPVAGALVRVEPFPWPVGVTDATGALAWAQGSGGEEPEPAFPRWIARRAEEPLARLVVSTPDGRRIERPVPAEDEAPVILPSGSDKLAGRVLARAAQGEPIGLPRALAFWADDPGASTHSEARGAYRLPRPAADAPRLEIRAPSHLPASSWPRDVIDSENRLPTVPLDPAIELRGRVVDPSGRAVSGAWIEARPDTYANRNLGSASRGEMVVAHADADGSFALRGLLAGGSYLVRAATFGGSGRMVEIVAPRLGAARREIELVLEPHRAAFGRVIDLEGLPVADATVWLSPSQVEASAAGLAADLARAHETVRVVTDAEGRFELRALPARRLDVTVEARGYSDLKLAGIEVTIPRDLGKPADVGSFVASPGFVIHGRVIDADGAPIAGATVHDLDESLSPATFSPWRRSYLLSRRSGGARTGADGRFVVEDLEPGARRLLWVVAEGWLPRQAGVVEAPTERPVIVVLEPAARIAGQVVDESGDAVAQASVTAEWDELDDDGEPTGENGSDLALVDADGAFRLEVRPGAEVLLGVSAIGFVDAEGIEVRAPPAGETTTRRIVLRSGASVKGTVTSAGGEPLAGVHVDVAGARATTDDEGRYSAAGATEGKGAAFVYHERYGRQQREVEIESGVNVVDWTLEEGWPVSGRVVDTNGEPVAGAELSLEGGRLAGGASETRSGADGGFVFERVTAASYRLRADHRGYAPALRDEPVVVGDAPVEGLVIELVAGATVFGRVLGLEPDELLSVRVGAGSSERRGAAGSVRYDGSYEIRNLPPGSWTLFAALDGRRRMKQERIRIEPGEERVERDLVFDERLALGGRVHRAHEAQSGLRVELAGVDFEIERWAITDRQGEFRVEDLDPGRYRLTVQSGFGRVHHRREIDLTADEWLDVELRPASLAGRVVDASGDPLADAYLWLRSAEDLELQLGFTQSGGDGTFAFYRLPAGGLLLEARLAGHGSRRLEIELEPGEERSGLEIVLAPSGEVLLAPTLAGAVPAQISLLVLDASGLVVRALRRRPDATGLVELDGLSAGAWTLLAVADGSGLVRVPLEVPTPAPVALPLPPAGSLSLSVPDLFESSLYARATLADAAGTLFETLELHPARVRSSFTLRAGTVTVPHLPAGRWTVTVEATDGRTWTTEAETSTAPATLVLD